MTNYMVGGPCTLPSINYSTQGFPTCRAAATLQQLHAARCCQLEKIELQCAESSLADAAFECVLVLLRKHLHTQGVNYLHHPKSINTNLFTSTTAAEAESCSNTGKNNISVLSFKGQFHTGLCFKSCSFYSFWQ